MQISGVHSPSTLALLLSQHGERRLNQRPHLVITATLEEAEVLQQSLKFFDPSKNSHILTGFEVDIYSGVYPNQRNLANRIKWLNLAHNTNTKDIFIAPIANLLQKTIPFQRFASEIIEIKTGSVLADNIKERLQNLGYMNVQTVEDVGTYAWRGGILDIFSPAHDEPFRVELFADNIESIRFFSPSTQISSNNALTVQVLPARETLYGDTSRQSAAKALRASAQERKISDSELADILRSISLGQPFYGMDFLLPYFYQDLSSPIDYFSEPVDVWYLYKDDVLRTADELWQNLKSSYESSSQQVAHVHYEDIYSKIDQIRFPDECKFINVNRVEFSTGQVDAPPSIPFNSVAITDFLASLKSAQRDPQEAARLITNKLSEWRARGNVIFLICRTSNSAERIRALLEPLDFRIQAPSENSLEWNKYIEESRHNLKMIYALIGSGPDSFRLPEEGIVFINDFDLLSKRRTRSQEVQTTDEFERAQALSFGELQPGELIVHRIHGIGIYEGLKPMEIQGAASEFIDLKYKDGDRLYIPVYRIGQLQKYIGPGSLGLVDKLGGTGWQKTKTKVSHQLRDIANKLLQLYARRASLTRDPYPESDDEYNKFSSSFLYDETPDQMRAINSVISDLISDKPMDRLICGDVGFGKTEVAMRAAFKVVENKKQVAIIAPTTILTFQHFENFKKRFREWPIEIRALNRFVSSSEIKKTLSELKDGRVDIVIGTHRLLSKDVHFKNLGLLVVDEEQKFGVAHKERLRQLRENVDTLAMSATPIPRTLNMSLVGIRDLSLINTPPEDRLPTRTFVCKFEAETIRKAIESEISRGGQVFFLHNRIQSIDEIAAQLREIVPTARVAIGHGQMKESELEKVMLRFFNHDLDVLLCTAIIESGMDIPRANTILIDNAHTFGVSQLYQLRGRVGRSKERAYCYLMLPPDKKVDAQAMERLKIIQDNSALGSGIRVAQYDLELRGAGDILGENQSGHIASVGYELYMDLLEETLNEQKGVAHAQSEIEPEINLHIPALFPDKYIPDIRMRLYYYKALSQIRSEEDIDRIENELRDQFGAPPAPVLNLFGLMLIRKYCRDLGVRDVSAGKANVTLAFTDSTRLPPNEVVRLTTAENKKYQLTSEQRLKIRMNEVTWPRVVDELLLLLRLCPKTQG